MSYKILEVHQNYKNGKLDELAVLWESNDAGWVRASYANSQPCNGYKFLLSSEIEKGVSDRLIQDVAGTGMNLPDNKKKKYFPGKRAWEQ